MPLSPDLEQSRDLYAHAGLALYWAQCFEMSLENFLVIHARLSNKTISLADLEFYEADVQRNTLGRLLREVRQCVAFDACAEATISDALQKRNLLAHRFFKEKAIEALSAEGRTQMIDQLRDYQQSFQMADAVASAIAQAAGKVIGITDEMVDQEIKKLIKNNDTLA